MADYTVVAANVLPSSGANLKQGIAGATITAGNVLYKDPSDKSLKLASATSATAAARVVEGIAVDGAAAGQPLEYAFKDPSFSPGFSVPIGDAVILSATAGNLCPHADAITGHYVTVLGVGITGNKMGMGFVSSGAAKA
jgi:hypothetical protein